MYEVERQNYTVWMLLIRLKNTLINQTKSFKEMSTENNQGEQKLWSFETFRCFYFDVIHLISANVKIV